MAEFDELKKQVESHIKSVMDFPKPGINFRDIMPLFKHPDLIAKLCKSIADHARPKNIQAVAGLEARGFLFGPQIAMHLNVPFVPIRKKGKLPGTCLEASFTKEYGTDTVQIQDSSVNKGDRILIIDDLLATGGTLKAACELLKNAGCVIAEAFVLIELASLNGRRVVGEEVPVTALLSYEKE